MQQDYLLSYDHTRTGVLRMLIVHAVALMVILGWWHIRGSSSLEGTLLFGVWVSMAFQLSQSLMGVHRRRTARTPLAGMVEAAANKVHFLVPFTGCCIIPMIGGVTGMTALWALEGVLLALVYVGYVVCFVRSLSRVSPDMTVEDRIQYRFLRYYHGFYYMAAIVIAIALTARRRIPWETPPAVMAVVLACLTGFLYWAYWGFPKKTPGDFARAETFFLYSAVAMLGCVVWTILYYFGVLTPAVLLLVAPVVLLLVPLYWSSLAKRVTRNMTTMPQSAGTETGNIHESVFQTKREEARGWLTSSRFFSVRDCATSTGDTDGWQVRCYVSGDVPKILEMSWCGRNAQRMVRFCILGRGEFFVFDDAEVRQPFGEAGASLHHGADSVGCRIINKHVYVRGNDARANAQLIVSADDAVTALEGWESVDIPWYRTQVQRYVESASNHWKGQAARDQRHGSPPEVR